MPLAAGHLQNACTHLGVVSVRRRHLKRAHAVLDAPQVAVGAQHQALAQQRRHHSLARNHHTRLAVRLAAAGNAAQWHVAGRGDGAPEADACNQTAEWALPAIDMSCCMTDCSVRGQLPVGSASAHRPHQAAACCPRGDVLSGGKEAARPSLPHLATPTPAQSPVGR